MRSCSLARATFFLLCLVPSIYASPDSYLGYSIEPLVSPDEEPIFRAAKRHEHGTVVVTGVQHYGTPPRLEIRQMQADKDLFNIFLLGLARFHATPQHEKLSYYDICTIHGRPFGTWDGVKPSKGGTDEGYCTHVSNLILPWHRPYLALYEQELHKHILHCAHEFPDGPQRQKYVKAAKRARIPYWDWAVSPVEGGVYLDILQREHVRVTTPKGEKTIPNPLFSYKFQKSTKNFEVAPFTDWPRTLRYPNQVGPQATSQNSLIAPQVEKQRGNMASRLYRLLTLYGNFTKFSTEAWHADDPQHGDSVEALHNMIHSTCGKAGHMTYLGFGAFDPLFWLHHAQLDRLLSIYLILHPHSYVEPMTAITHTYTIQKGSRLDGNTPLTPFHKDTAGHFWTSNTVKTTTQFGYTYPETPAGVTKAQVNAIIKALYGKRGSSKHKREAGQEIFENALGQSKEYDALIVSNKHALNASYAIYVFLGEFNESDPKSWPTDPNLAGTHATFSGIFVGEVDERPSVVTSGVVPLTEKLLEKWQEGELSSMDDAAVEDYVEKNLQWRAALFDDQAVPLEQVSDLSVIVTSAIITDSASDDEFPTRTNFSQLTHLTLGKVGGC